MNRLRILLLFCMTTFLISCSGTSYWIDNPTNEAITVYIDDTAYNIPALSTIKTSVSYGKHQLKYDGQQLTFHNAGRTNDVPAMINPTQSTYVFYRQIFMNENDERATDEFAAWALKTQSDSLTLSINDTITTVFVPFNTSNNLFISKTDFDWQLMVGEPMPEGVKLTNPIVTRRNRGLMNDENYKAGKFQEPSTKYIERMNLKSSLNRLAMIKSIFYLRKHRMQSFLARV